MKTANTVFWCSFFVNQRGCPVHLLRPLFNYLVEHSAFINELTLAEKESYEREFVKTHDDLLNKFVKSIDDICEEWSESEAGAAFIAIFEKMKYIPVS
jgi:hypothetical protein